MIWVSSMKAPASFSWATVCSMPATKFMMVCHELYEKDCWFYLSFFLFKRIQSTRLEFVTIESGTVPRVTAHFPLMFLHIRREFSSTSQVQSCTPVGQLVGWTPTSSICSSWLRYHALPSGCVFPYSQHCHQSPGSEWNLGRNIILLLANFHHELRENPFLYIITEWVDTDHCRG